MVRKTHRQKVKQESEDWMQKKWRPMMALLYMGICAFDFIIAPVLWSLAQALFHGGLTTQWQPLTLQGAGLLHLSFGAVLGISAYGRTQEKINGSADGNGGVGFGPGAGTTYIPPNQNMNNGMGGGFNNNQSNGFGNNQSNGFGGNNNTGFGTNTTSGFGGNNNTGFGTNTTSGFGSPPANSGFSSNLNNTSAVVNTTNTVTPPPTNNAAGPVRVVTGYAGKASPAPIPDAIL